MCEGACGSVASGSQRRLWAATCLVLTSTLVVPPGTAHAQPKPSLSEARKKMDSLNEQVDKLVEKYDQVKEDLKAAKRKYAVTKAAADREQAIFERMRERVAQMAATA